MTKYSSRAATAPVFEMGEGILWDDRAGVARWVDMTKGRVLAGELTESLITIVSDVSIGQNVGAVALAEDGGLLVAASRSLATISPSGTVAVGPDLLTGKPDSILNDGAVDPYGSFVVGTYSSAKDANSERLLRVSPSGTVEVIREHLCLPNGVGFSPDGATIYNVDTLAGNLSSHSYSAEGFDEDEP